MIGALVLSVFDDVDTPKYSWASLFASRIPGSFPGQFFSKRKRSHNNCQNQPQNSQKTEATRGPDIDIQRSASALGSLNKKPRPRIQEGR